MKTTKSLTSNLDLKKKRELHSIKVKKKHHSTVVIKVNHLEKSFQVSNNKIPILKDISFKVYSKDFLIIFGPSGCGKSTLLNVILGLEEPDSGEVILRDTKTYSLNESERADIRAKRLGVVYQQPTWIRSLSVLDNVAYPLILTGESRRNAINQALRRLEEMGLSKFRNYAPTELSGGQQQKVSLARALVKNPWTLFLDEPTGNLDSKSEEEIIKMLTEINRKGKRTIVMVTHNYSFLLRANRVLHLLDGEVKGIHESIHEIQQFLRNQLMPEV